MREFGIDYARVDGNKHPVGFKKAYEAGCRFAIMRGAWGVTPDTIVRRDAAGLRAAGITVGTYLFLRCPTKMQDVASPETQARTFIATVGPHEPGDLPVTLDVEFPGEGRKATTLSARQAVEWCEQAYDTLRQVYPAVMIYTSHRVWHEDLVDLESYMGAGPLWIKTAYYWKTDRRWDVSHSNPIKVLPAPWAVSKTSQAHSGPGAWIQQIQGDAIGMPGFSNTVDINLFLTMQIGEKSARVRWVQKLVKTSLIDGDFGPKTEAAVRSFQESHKLPVTGIVDVRTFAALCS